MKVVWNKKTNRHNITKVKFIDVMDTDITIGCFLVEILNKYAEMADDIIDDEELLQKVRKLASQMNSLLKDDWSDLVEEAMSSKQVHAIYTQFNIEKERKTKEFFNELSEIFWRLWV